MTSKELFNKMKPSTTKLYLAQSTEKGLEFNHSHMFSTLIKDAARCNGYNSDVYYDLKYLEDRFENFSEEEEFEPIWIGFRKLGVDCTNFVLCRCADDAVYGSMSNNYFALYSVSVEKDEAGWYDVHLNEYAV